MVGIAKQILPGGEHDRIRYQLRNNWFLGRSSRIRGPLAEDPRGRFLALPTIGREARNQL